MSHVKFQKLVLLSAPIFQCTNHVYICLIIGIATQLPSYPVCDIWIRWVCLCSNYVNTSSWYWVVFKGLGIKVKFPRIMPGVQIHWSNELDNKRCGWLWGCSRFSKDSTCGKRVQRVAGTACEVRPTRHHQVFDEDFHCIRRSEATRPWRAQRSRCWGYRHVWLGRWGAPFRYFCPWLLVWPHR